MSFRINVPAGVENEAKYIAAAEARIRENARKGRFDRWIKTEGAERIQQFLHQFGEFDHIRDESGQFKAVHPVVKASFGSFFDKMRDALHDYGSLTEKQHAAVLAMIERAEKRVAERAEKRAAEAAASQWVGTVGERIEITAKIVHIHEMEGDYGMSYITVMKDADDNTIVQKGASIKQKREFKNQWGDTEVGSFDCDKGDTVRLKATVKDHSVRDGVKQTVICRAKALEIINTEEEA